MNKRILADVSERERRKKRKERMDKTTVRKFAGKFIKADFHNGGKLSRDKKQQQQQATTRNNTEKTTS
jgi:hypothetical protein